jgi:hypothetical protein
VNRRRQADRKLHLELLRARAAAHRLELSLAVQDIADQLHPLQRAADSLAAVAGALGGRGRALRWLAAVVAALAQGHRLRRTALGALGAWAVARLVRYARRSLNKRSIPTDRGDPG